MVTRARAQLRLDGERIAEEPMRAGGASLWPRLRSLHSLHVHRSADGELRGAIVYRTRCVAGSAELVRLPTSSTYDCRPATAFESELDAR